ncbi:hypothetical protein BH23ACT9_BH23ACT9_12110 [soil metagenome]
MEPTPSVLIIGATGGIGRALMQQLTDGGRSLVLAARDAGLGSLHRR